LGEDGGTVLAGREISGERGQKAASAAAAQL